MYYWNISFVSLDPLSKSIYSLHIALSFSSFSFICFNILYPHESGNGVLTWRLNPRRVHYGKTAKSADGAERYSSEDKEHTWPPCLYGLLCKLFVYSISTCVCVCVILWLYCANWAMGSPEYTIRRVMVSSTVLPPFPNAAKSFPTDQILSDRSRQLSLNFIRTDMPAPWRQRLRQRRGW